jgi:predicted ATPase
VKGLADEISSSRLFTLVGPGGVGKTRLAIEAARTASDGFPDGVWFVELGPVSQGAAVEHVVASTLGRPHRHRARRRHHGRRRCLRRRHRRPAPHRSSHSAHHLTHVYTKLGLPNRAALAAAAARRDEYNNTLPTRDVKTQA